MTIQSFTDPNKTYETTPEQCDCPDFRFRHHQCKHQKALIRELNRATIFLMLKMKFDIRQNGRQFTYFQDGQLHEVRRIDWDAILDNAEQRSTAPLYRPEGFSLLR